MADRRGQLPDYYAVLGARHDASHEELRRAWRAAVKRWHPDRNRSPDAHRMMARINEAWDVLGDPAKRAEYDALNFSMRATWANEEHRRRAEERHQHEQRERARRDRERRAATERQRAAEAERLRVAEQARRERERLARERQERMRRERERMEAEERRRKAEADRLERERKAREKQERARLEQVEKRRKREARRRMRAEAGSLVAYLRESVQSYFAPRLRGLRQIDRLQTSLGFALGVFASAVLALALIALPDLQLPWTGSDSAPVNELVETAGWGTVHADGTGTIDCSAYGRDARNVVAFGEYPRADAQFLTPDVSEWSAGFLYHLSGSGYSAAVLRRSGDEFHVRHWRQTRAGESATQESRIRPDLLHPGGSSAPNQLQLEVSDAAGSELIVNGATLVHVPRLDLRPISSAVHFCTGWYGGEPAYTVQFVGLRGTIQDGALDPQVLNPVEYWPAGPAP